MTSVQPTQSYRAASVRQDEIARFDALARHWWDQSGPMAPLHAMNPLRVGWISRRLEARFDGPVRLLDVGCGAGLAAEALARLGLDHAGVSARNPRIIHVSCCGFDQEGPDAALPAYDDLIQSASGLADVLPRTDGNPTPRILPTLVADKV